MGPETMKKINMYQSDQDGQTDLLVGSNSYFHHNLSVRAGSKDSQLAL